LLLSVLKSTSSAKPVALNKLLDLLKKGTNLN
jgi:hypothetical protein